MSFRCKKTQDQELFTKSKASSWRGREGRKNRSRRSRSLVLPGSTSTTDSGYTSEKSDLDTLRSQRSRRTSTSSTASRASFMPSVCYHCQIADSSGSFASSTTDKGCESKQKRCFRAHNTTDTSESIPVFDHSPYASLRQLFYEKEPQTRPTRRKGCIDTAPPGPNSPMLLSWRQIPPSPLPDHIEVKLREQTSTSRRRRKALHLSLYGTPSYADLYLPSQGGSKEPTQNTRTPRSNTRSKGRRRVRSYDPSKFEKLLGSEDVWTAEKENQNVFMENYKEIYFQDKTGSRLNELWRARQTSLKTGFYQRIQSGESVFGTVPWMKRQSSATKRNKKAERSDSSFLSTFFDKLRTINRNTSEPVFNLVERSRKVSEPENQGVLFGKTKIQLAFLRSRLSPQNRAGDWICDGRFGCSDQLS